jgi:hypothetical protein
MSDLQMFLIQKIERERFVIGAVGRRAAVDAEKRRRCDSRNTSKLPLF